MRSHHGDNLKSSFCGSPCGSFCGSPSPRSAPRSVARSVARSAPRTPNRGTPRVPFCEAIYGDREMLTTYSPNPCQRTGAQRRLPTPHPICIAAFPSGPMVVAVADPSVRPIIATLACRSGGFRFLVPDSPLLSAAARLAGFGRIRDKPDTMDRDGCETTRRGSDGC